MKDSTTKTSGEIISDKKSWYKLEEMQSELQACIKTEDDSNDSCGKSYSVELTPGQHFHCSETGLKFQVRFPATIRYDLEYGKEYGTQIAESGYEIIGPLFKIEAPERAVSEVSLPHYACLDDLSGDKSLIKCGHFKDGKMTLKTPDKIEASYIVLKDPTFSCVATILRPPHFWKLRRKFISFHGKVLMYVRVVCPQYIEDKLYRIHLYLIPRDQPQLKKLDEYKLKSGFKRLDKPHQTNSLVYLKKKYTVHGNPHLSLTNEFLQLNIHVEPENYPFLEIDVGGEATEVVIYLKPEGREEKVWKGKLAKGDLQEITEECIQKGGSGGTEYFVVKYRHVLIEKVTRVEPVLDGLRKEAILTEEQYQTVKSKETSMEQMRELYRHINTVEANKKLHCILKTTNKSLIRELEEGDSRS